VKEREAVETWDSLEIAILTWEGQRRWGERRRRGESPFPSLSSLSSFLPSGPLYIFPYPTCSLSRAYIFPHSHFSRDPLIADSPSSLSFLPLLTFPPSPQLSLFPPSSPPHATYITHPISSWITWFLSTKGNEYFAEVDEDYILDRFNLTGLNSEVVQEYPRALELITDSLGEWQPAFILLEGKEGWEGRRERCWNGRSLN